MNNFYLFKYIKEWILFSIFILCSSFLGAEEDTRALELIQVCHFELAYRDKGSGGDQDVAIYRPHAPSGYYIIGDYAQGDYRKTSVCTLAVKPSSRESAGLLIAPGHWELVWADKGSGAHMDGSVWHPVSPDKNYVCIGSVGQTGYNKPSLQNYRCVHQCLVENVQVKEHLWSDRGTSARNQVSMYKIGNSGLFYAKPDRKKPSTLSVLKTNPVCTRELETISNQPTENKRVNPDEVKPKKNEWVNPDEVQTMPEKKTGEWVNPDTSSVIRY